MTRRPAVVKVQIARKALGLAEDDYRSILERLTGRTSSADCSDAELGRVLDEFKAKGWIGIPVAARSKGSAFSTRRAADHPSAKKARALWLSLWNLGEVRDPSEAALEAFARRQLKAERLQWADQALVYKLIEALKAMAERAGWSQDVSGLAPGTDPILVLKRGLIAAQLKRLGRPAEATQIPEHALNLKISDLGWVVRDRAATGPPPGPTLGRPEDRLRVEKAEPSDRGPGDTL